jgi:hypothetical protein
MGVQHFVDGPMLPESAPGFGLAKIFSIQTFCLVSYHTRAIRPVRSSHFAAPKVMALTDNLCHLIQISVTASNSP